ncbi:MAG: ribosome silencing factor [Armatimonadota bacterium]|nr:ribosome silencing factor [Armatimonadota bacterium]MDR5697592.1 ribosome silencing factor [Armatimonadota bacterium]
MTPGDRARIAARAAEDRRAEDVVVLDLREQTLITDYFVIATGQTNIQIRAIADGVEEALAASGARLLRREGTERGRWLLLDFGDVVVHVFGPEERKFYRLERLWGAAARPPTDPQRRTR